MATDNSAAWAAAGEAASTAASVIATSNTNKKTKKWNEQMMQRQRDWALADWARNNEYNSPRAQMERLKEAGLNPNLVYGNGATTEAANIRSTDTPSWNPQAPDFKDAGRSLSTYQDVRLKKQQNDLMKQQIAIAERDAQLKALQASALELGIIEKRFDIDLKGELRPYNVSIRKKMVEQFDQNIMESLTRMSNATWQMNLNSQANERAWQENTRSQGKYVSDMSTAELQRDIMRMSMNKTTEEINQIRRVTDNLIKDGKMKDMMNRIQQQLGDTGITTSDPGYFKLIVAFLQQIKEGKIKMY